jgi:hypothetical protein
MFLEIAQTIYQAYLVRLTETGDEDFDGLMQRAADSIAGGGTAMDEGISASAWPSRSAASGGRAGSVASGALPPSSFATLDLPCEAIARGTAPIC